MKELTVFCFKDIDSFTAKLFNSSPKTPEHFIREKLSDETINRYREYEKSLTDHQLFRASLVDDLNNIFGTYDFSAGMTHVVKSDEWEEKINAENRMSKLCRRVF